MDLLYGFIFFNQKYALKGFSDILIKSFEEIYLKLQQNTEIGSIIMLLSFYETITSSYRIRRQVSSADCTSTELFYFFLDATAFK